MKPWHLLWRLVRFQPLYYFLDGLLWIGFWVLLLIPGLIVRTFFDTLTGNAQAGIGIWGLIALLVATQVARTAIVFPSAAVDVTFRMTGGALLSKNLLERILDRPGAQALPGSPSEAISRFRDDVDEINMFIGRPLFLDFVGTAFFAVAALVVMLGINVLLTLVVFVPLVGVVAAARMASARIGRGAPRSMSSTGSMRSTMHAARRHSRISCLVKSSTRSFVTRPAWAPG